MVVQDVRNTQNEIISRQRKSSEAFNPMKFIWVPLKNVQNLGIASNKKMHCYAASRKLVLRKSRFWKNLFLTRDTVNEPVKRVMKPQISFVD